jgi:hypothetical protein
MTIALGIPPESELLASTLRLKEPERLTHCSSPPIPKTTTRLP